MIAAKRRVPKLAERFSDPDWRACHLAHPENVATLALPELPAATTPATSFDVANEPGMPYAEVRVAAIRMRRNA